MTKLPVIVLGCGGHSRVIIDLLKCGGRVIKGVTSPNFADGDSIWGVTRLGSDEILDYEDSNAVELAIGFGSVGVSGGRKLLFEKMSARGFQFATLVHPSAIVSSDVQIFEGSQIMAGSVIQAGVTIGKNCIINTGSLVDHDVEVGDHSHLAPGVTCSGAVTIGAGSHLGTGSTVIEGVSIGKNSMVAAGAVVVADVLPNSRVKGIPARPY